MPRKPASKLENNENEKIENSVSVKKTAKKKNTKVAEKDTTEIVKKSDKTAEKKASSSAKKPAKTVAKKVSETTTKDSKSVAKKTTKTTKSAVEKVPKTVTKTSKATTKKASKTADMAAKSAKSTTKKSATKKTSTTKASTKRASSKSSSSRAKKSNKEIDVNEITSTTDLTRSIEVLEYYDLPYRYNQTVVKVLAQTPTTLFIYWDISDADRANFVAQYGEDFFSYTKPVLVIHNNTMNYSFEVEIDDFANSWYLHVNDSNCEYTVELGRRTKYYNEERHMEIPNNYLYVTSSNVIDSPNDHVLFDKNLKTVYFRDVKTNIVTAKDITSISFLRNMGRIYDLYDLQGDFNNNSWQLDLRNSSSSNSSPTYK